MAKTPDPSLAFASLASFAVEPPLLLTRGATTDTEASRKRRKECRGLNGTRASYPGFLLRLASFAVDALAWPLRPETQ